MLSRAARRNLLRHSCLAVVVLSTVMCCAGVFQHSLWTPDEPREAEIGREMLASHWSAMPTLGGEAFLEKPPLFPWVMAAGYRLFGISPGIARLPAALFSIGSILVAYWIGRRVGGRSAGVLSALVLCTCAEFAIVSHSAVNDTALIFFVSAGHLAILTARDRHRSGMPSFGLAWAGLCAGLAFLTKGFIGPVLLFGPALLASICAREWSFVRFALPRAFAWCAVSTTAIGLPWVFALAGTGGWSAVRVCLVDNTLGRSVHAAREFGHANGPLYYLTAVPLNLLPWTLVLPAALVMAFRSHSRRSDAMSYLVWLFFTGIILLSVPATKRELYALPLFPAGAAVIGGWLSHLGARRANPFEKATLASVIVLVAMALIVVAAIFGYLATDRTLPLQARAAGLSIRESSGRLPCIAAGLLAGIAGTILLAFVTTARARPSSTRAYFAVASAFAAFLLWHGVLTPLVDPIKDMRPATLAMARAVPEEEPLLGLRLDETTLAVVPFYTGRMIREVGTADRAIEELEAGPAHHLVVMSSMDSAIEENLRIHLREVAIAGPSAPRGLNVYRFEKDR